MGAGASRIAGKERPNNADGPSQSGWMSRYRPVCHFCSQNMASETRLPFLQSAGTCERYRPWIPRLQMISAESLVEYYGNDIASRHGPCIEGELRTD